MCGIACIGLPLVEDRSAALPLMDDAARELDAPCGLFKLAGNASEGSSDGRDVSAVKRLPDLG